MIHNPVDVGDAIDMINNTDSQYIDNIKNILNSEEIEYPAEIDRSKKPIIKEIDDMPGNTDTRVTVMMDQNVNEKDLAMLLSLAVDNETISKKSQINIDQGSVF